jgi:hypothetical protein
MTAFRVVTLDERPDLADAADAVAVAGWPEFMLNDPIADEYFGALYQDLGAFQFVLLDQHDSVAALGNTVPVVWDGRVENLSPRGWDWALESGVTGYQRGIAPNTLSAIQAVVAKNYLGQGVSQEILKTMKMIAARHSLNTLIAPVRPNLKHRYPLTPMERYIHWTHDETGAPFDSWLRVHWKLGARILRVCPESMTITAPVAEWEKWTDMRFPESGTYIVPGALSPLEISREADQGTYVEPNVWMRHSLSK